MKTEPVFLLAGQSNMAGRCHAGALPFNLLTDTKFTVCWNNDSNFGLECGSHSNGEFRPLQCQPSPGLENSFFGPEMGLAETLGPRLVSANIPRAHFLKFAMGSANPSHNWNPNHKTDDSESPSKQAHYGRFIEFCQTTLNSHPHMKLSALFWLQGESDSSQSKTAKAYGENYKSFVQAVRRDLKVPYLPVVTSPVVWKGKHLDKVNRALLDAGNDGIAKCVSIDPIMKKHWELQSYKVTKPVQGAWDT